MANTKYKTNETAMELRREAGTYVKKLRMKAGLSQLDLSRRLGLDYYSFISQVEMGVTRVPPEKVREWARALDVDVKVFAKTLLRYYDPFTFDALFN